MFKTSSKCLDQNEYIHTSSIRLEDVFKTSSKRLAKTSRRLGKMFSRHLQDVFKMYHQVKLLLFNRSSTGLRDVLRIRLSTERFALATPLRNLWSVYKFSKSEPFAYTKTFRTFSKTLYEMIAFTNKGKVGYQKSCFCLNK